MGIGASTGYGLASRIVAAFGCGAQTLGVFFAKPASQKRAATAGWCNDAAFQKEADAGGLYAKNINGDAFSDEVKQRAIELIKSDFGQGDLVIYSLAAPRRLHRETGVAHISALKPIGKPITLTGLDTGRAIVKEFTIEPATQAEIDNTVAVMGGDEWRRWMQSLRAAGVIAPDCKTTAYTYIGEKITRAIYWGGAIGAAKQHLDRTAADLRAQGLNAAVSVLKGVATQSSAAIPVMPLYWSLLFKVMKQAGLHEGCIEQIRRLLAECLYADKPRLDDAGRYRVDEKEMRPQVQQQVETLWSQVTTKNLHALGDYQGFRADFLKLFGVGLSGVDYVKDVATDAAIGNLADMTVK